MLLSLLTILILPIQEKETITFPSDDGVTITADLYMPHPKDAPMILLFHQASWSRGEYLEIAPKLNELGYNCLAVDLRSGKSINNIVNETHASARQLFKETQYINALVDMESAVKYARKELAEGDLIIWGSSYSAALTLKIVGDHPDWVDAGLAFSPGEYFTSQGKPRDYITRSAAHIERPVFITSAHNEKSNWWGIYVAISDMDKTYFWPSTTGNHGSRALWSKFPDSAEYWEAVKSFLQSLH